MPLYDYICKGCSTVFQKRMTFSEFEKRKKQVCPKCGANGERYILNSPSIKFKGKGFYVNDSKK